MDVKISPLKKSIENNIIRNISNKNSPLNKMEQLKQDSKRLILENDAISKINHWMYFGVEIDDNPEDFSEITPKDLRVIINLYKLVLQNKTTEEIIFWRGFSGESTEREFSAFCK